MAIIQRLLVPTCEEGSTAARREKTMQSDWYRTTKSGTYIIVPTGADPLAGTLPEEVRSMLEMPLRLYCKDVSSAEMARSFDFLGVEAYLSKNGYCVLRS